MLEYGPIIWSSKKKKWIFTFIYRGRVHRSCECSYSMFVVAGNTWRVWDQFRYLYSHLLWQREYHSNLNWSNTKSVSQKHWYPYALHQRTCAWWGHWSAILCIIWASCRHIYQDVFWEDLQHSQFTAWDRWSCGEDKLNTIFHTVLFMSMFEGGFSHLWLCLFSLFCMDKQYVKGD